MGRSTPVGRCRTLPLRRGAGSIARWAAAGCGMTGRWADRLTRLSLPWLPRAQLPSTVSGRAMSVPSGALPWPPPQALPAALPRWLPRVLPAWSVSAPPWSGTFRRLPHSPRPMVVGTRTSSSVRRALGGIRCSSRTPCRRSALSGRSLLVLVLVPWGSTSTATLASL